MPLLMAFPDVVLPPEAAGIVEGGTAKAFPVAVGQLLAVKDIEGGQPAAMFVINPATPEIFLSPHHTRVFSNSFLLRLGMRMVTNKRRPVFVLGKSAPHLRHDLLMPLGAPLPPDGGPVGGAFRAAGLEPRRIADPVNLFLDVAVGLDGALLPNGVSSRPGDGVLMRAVMDVVVALHAPSADPELWKRSNPGPIAYHVFNDVPRAEAWLSSGE